MMAFKPMIKLLTVASGLFDRSGNTVESFNTQIAPESRSLIAQIERRLVEKP